MGEWYVQDERIFGYTSIPEGLSLEEIAERIKRDRRRFCRITLPFMSERMVLPPWSAHCFWSRPEEFCPGRSVYVLGWGGKGKASKLLVVTVRKGRRNRQREYEAAEGSD